MVVEPNKTRRTHSRPVVQVTAEICGTASAPAERALNAIRAVLAWLREKQRVSLPDEADRGESFDIDASEAFPVAAVRFDTYWALQFDKFAPDVPGRIWRTEVTVAHTEERVFGGVRLTVLDIEAGLDFNPSVPAIVGTWARSPGLIDYAVQLADLPTVVRSPAELDSLAKVLTNLNRSRPVLVFSETKGIDVTTESTKAAQRLAGIAHVYVVDEALTSRLTERFGREFSVWGGAIRTYMPGFNPAVDEVTRHPPATRDWLSRRFRNLDQFFDVLLRSFTALSIKRTGIDQDLPSFRTVKQASLSYQLAKLPSPKTGERVAILEQENILLKQQVQEKIDEYNYADGEVTAAQQERDQYRAQVMALRTLIQRLEGQTGSIASGPDFPEDLNSVDDWVLNQYPGRMLLLNRAARAAKKSPFNDPLLVYRCLDRLAREYVDARREGRAVDDVFGDLGVALERTGDPNRLSQWKEKYFIPHRGSNCFLEWHLKRGTDHNDATTMRIYFFYDQDDEQVIVGYLPGHLTNSQT